MSNEDEVAATQTRKQIELASAFGQTFSTKEGEKVLADLMREGHMLASSYRGDIDDTVFNEGKRSLVLYILQQMNVNVSQLKRAYEQNEEGKDYGYFK